MKLMKPAMIAPALVLAGSVALSACQTAAENPAAGTATPAAASVAATAADAPPAPAAVVNMVSNCFSCHGPDGRSPGAIPGLTGMTTQQALFMMKGFKSGDIPSTVMTRHAKGYSDAELEAIANYIGSNLK